MKGATADFDEISFAKTGGQREKLCERVFPAIDGDSGGSVGVEVLTSDNLAMISGDES